MYIYTHTYSHTQWGHTHTHTHTFTPDLDCLLKEPLDLVEKSECEAADWLGDEAPDCEHDLSGAQSVETHMQHISHANVPERRNLSADVIYNEMIHTSRRKHIYTA